ncbi:MAG: hypothetical protein HY650_02240 [Acidobacteria bacterium]|nr:hypothetical protein [Acidobacteriota bacterium]
MTEEYIFKSINLPSRVIEIVGEAGTVSLDPTRCGGCGSVIGPGDEYFVHRPEQKVFCGACARVRLEAEGRKL